VFNANRDDVFDASEAKWSQFKAVVTNSDGSKYSRMRRLNGARAGIELAEHVIDFDSKFRAENICYPH
jgi:hypothetical protein